MDISQAILIRDGIIETLNTNTPTDIPEARKRRAFPGDPINESFIAVFLHAEPAQYPRGNNRSPVMERERMFIIQLGGVCEDAEDVDDQAEQLRAWVVQALGDTTLDGLLLSLEDRGIIEPPMVWKADAVYWLVHVGFVGKFQTSRINLGAQA